MGRGLLFSIIFGLSFSDARSQIANLDDLPRLTTGKVKAANALWIETPMAARTRRTPAKSSSEP